MKLVIFLILIIHVYPLHSFSKEDELFYAISDKNFERVQEIINQKVNVNAKNQFGETPIMRAVLYGEITIVELLLTNGADLSVKDDDFDPVLIKSIYSHRFEVTKKIVEKTRNVDIRGKKNYTALMIASNQGDYPLVEYLIIKKANINLKNIYGDTPLILSARRGHLEIVRLLISSRAFISQKNNYGYTALHSAAYKGHLEVVKFLIKQDININEVDLNGNTALILAASQGHVEVVKILTESKANIFMRDKYGYSALKEASTKDNKEIIKILKNLGAVE